MRWAREKSPDHADCLARHLAERGTVDTDGLRHTAKIAWRALAMLQIELEGLVTSNADACEVTQECCPPVTAEDYDRIAILVAKGDQWNQLVDLGCDEDVADNIVDGTTYPDNPNGTIIYIAGPMRGYEHHNYPAFDEARCRLVKKGYTVISPADIDRAAGGVSGDQDDQSAFVIRDLYSLLLLKMGENPKNGLYMLPGWKRSKGACGEAGIADWLGLEIYREGSL